MKFLETISKSSRVPLPSTIVAVRGAPSHIEPRDFCSRSERCAAVAVRLSMMVRSLRCRRRHACCTPYHVGHAVSRKFWKKEAKRCVLLAAPNAHIRRPSSVSCTSAGRRTTGAVTIRFDGDGPRLARMSLGPFLEKLFGGCRARQNAPCPVVLARVSVMRSWGISISTVRQAARLFRLPGRCVVSSLTK